MQDGFVRRYDTGKTKDGLPGEGVFLACSFWLVVLISCSAAANRRQELFDRLIALRNDVGLLAEEYDPVARRQLERLSAGVLTCGIARVRP